MDFKFKIKLDNKTHKAAVHFPTPAAVYIAVKNIFYRHYKTDNIDIPYIDENQLKSFIDCGYMDMLGIKVNGKMLDEVKIEISEV